LCAAVSVAEWFWGVTLPATLRSGILIGVLFSAGAAIHASAMVYRDTPRLLWASRATLWRFVLTAALCGIPAWLVAGFDSAQPAVSLSGLFLLVPILMTAKLLLESRVYLHRNTTDFNPLWKAARLMSGELRAVWVARVALGIGGGILLPTLALFLSAGTSLWPLIALSGLLILGGELLERHLFFTTAIAPRMPGVRK
jgi:DMSO reductase anchor subunit